MIYRPIFQLSRSIYSVIAALGLAGLSGAREAETDDSTVGSMVGSGVGVGMAEGLGDGI